MNDFKFFADDKLLKLCNYDMLAVKAYYQLLVAGLSPITKCNPVAITLEDSGHVIRDQIILN